MVQQLERRSIPAEKNTNLELSKHDRTNTQEHQDNQVAHSFGNRLKTRHISSLAFDHRQVLSFKSQKSLLVGNVVAKKNTTLKAFGREFV
jgi:hypothetical protein